MEKLKVLEISFKNYCSKYEITTFSVYEDKIILLSNPKAEKVIYFGKKYKAFSQEELLEFGMILENGYDGKDWLWLSNILFDGAERAQ